MPPAQPGQGDRSFLSGGGETGAHLRAMDWSTTPLGPPEGWPAPLKTLVGVALNSKQPMLIVWGPDHTTLYNDGYAAMCGARHPAALGRPFEVLWAEIWHEVEPILAAAYAGQSTHRDHSQFTMLRNGYPEETHFAVGYTPVRGEDGAVAGMFCACTEITAQVIAGRRAAEANAALRDREERQTFLLALGDALRILDDPEEAVERASVLLGRHLRVNQVAFAEVDASGGFATIFRDWNDGTMPSNVGQHRLADFGPFIDELRAGGTVSIADIHRDPRTDEAGILASFGRVSTAALINVPLVKDGRLVAIFALLNREPRDWRDGDIALAREVAERIWDAVHRARAEAAERRRAGQLQALAAASLAITAASTLEERLEAVTRAACDIVGAHQGVTSLTYGRRWDQAIASTYLSAKYASFRCYDKVPDGSGIYALVCEEGRPLRLTQTELEAHPRWRRFGADAEAHPPLRGWLAAPLIARDGGTLGLIQLSDKVDGSDFDALDEAIIVQLAQIASVAVEQAQTSQALLDSEERLRLAATAAAIGTWDWDIVHGDLRWDDRCRALFGLSAGEPVTYVDSFLGGLHPDDQDRVQQAVKAALDPGGSGDYEVEYRTSGRGDGGERWVAARGKVLFRNRLPIRFIGTVIDITGRKTTEQALAAREAELRTILETIPVGVLLTELPSGRILRANRAAARILGHPVLPTPGMDDQIPCKGFHADGRPLHPDEYPLARLVQGAEEAPEIEMHCERGDGSRVWTRVMGRPVRNGAGELVGAVAALVDIDAERRLREESLRLAAEFRMLADNISQFAWMADAGGWIYWYNRRWYDYTGTTLADMQGWGWRSVHHPDHVDRVVEKISRHFAEGIPWEDTFPLRGREGGYRWFLSRAVPIRDDTGRIVRWFGTNTDIHDLREAQEEVQRASALLQLIGDSTPDLIYAKDLDCRMLYANAATLRVIGRPPEAVLGRLETDWAEDPGQAEIIRANDHRVMTSGETVDIDETFTTADGRTRYFRSNKSPLRDLDGRIIGLVGVTSDMTARRAAEERERLLAREVDHRAKNMLAVVQSLVQLTRAETVDSLKQAVSGRIHSLARAHSLLAESRWEGVDIGMLVKEELAPYADRECLYLTIDGPHQRLRPEAAQALALVLHELATNAAKYGALSQEGGCLDVVWHVATDLRAGPAGTEPDTDRLTLRWQERRGPPVMPPRHRGFGSTLIRMGVTHQLHGDVNLDWQAEGLVCTLAFPVERLSPDGPAWLDRPDRTEPVVPAAMLPAGCRVLVVEDEPLVALQIREALAEAGCTILGPASGLVEAVEQLSGTPIDMAILDVNLGGTPSFPVADILRARRVPFAFCTGYAGAAELPPRFAGVPILAKPFVVDDLIGTLGRLGEQGRAQHSVPSG